MSTHLLMISSTSFEEALLTFPLFPRNLPLFTVQSSLSSSCFCSDLSLSLAKVRLLPTLTLSPLVMWYSKQTALFVLLLARVARAFLPTALSVALRPLFPFHQVQFVQVFLLKPAPFCMLFAGLGNTNKSAISLLFCLTLTLSSPPCPLLHLSSYPKLCGRSGRNCLFFHPALSGYNGSPDTRFSQGMMWLMSWPDGERYSCPLQSLVVSFFLSLISTLVFSWTGGVLSHQNFLTHRFPRFPLRNLCSIVMVAVSSLIFGAVDTAFFLGSYLFRIGRIQNPFCSACGHSPQDTFHFILHCPAMDSWCHSLFDDFLSLYDLWSRPWRVAQLLGLHGFPPCPHPSEGVV